MLFRLDKRYRSNIPKSRFECIKIFTSLYLFCSVWASHAVLPCSCSMMLYARNPQENTYLYLHSRYLLLSWCGPNYLCSYQDYQVFCNRKYVLKISIADDTLFLSKMRSMDAYTLCNDNPESTKCLVVSG